MTTQTKLNPFTVKPQSKKKSDARAEVERLKAEIGELSLRAESPQWFRLMQEGVLVRLHILRWRAQTQITLEDLGLPQPKDDKEREIYDDLMNLGTKKLLPPDIIRKLNSLDSGARKHLEKYSFKTYWGNFVPVGAYKEWKEGNEKFCAEYLALGEQIVRQWNKTMEWTVDAYATAARQGYRRLLRLDPKSLTTHDGKRMSEDEFVDNFMMSRIQQAIPEPKQVKQSFGYETELSYIPLPSMLAEDWAKKERIEAQRQLERATERVAEQKLSERERMMRQMNADVVRETRQRKQELANQFVRDIQSQSLSIIYDGFVNVLESIQKNDGALVGKAAEQIRNIVDTWRAMNLVGDQEIEGQIARISGVMNKPATERTPGEVQALLKEIATAARANLVSLGASPRSARSVGISDSDKVEPLALRRGTRQEQLKLDE